MLKTLELARELDAAIAAMTEADRQRLIALGLPQGLLAAPLPMVGVSNIRVDGDTYQPDEYGGTAFITPILVGDSHTPEAADPDSGVRFAGDLVDLVAWRPDRLDTWATRVGAAEWIGAIAPQCLAPPPVEVWRHPLDWLRPGAAAWRYSRQSAPHNGPFYQRVAVELWPGTRPTPAN